MSEEELQNAATEAAAMAIGDYLMEANRLAAPIRSLTFEELRSMASAAISGWVVKRAQQAKEQDPKIWPSLLSI